MTNDHSRSGGRHGYALDDALLRALFEHTPDGVLLSRPDGTVLRANSAACRMLGRSEDEIIALGRQGLVLDSPSLRHMLNQRSEEGRTAGELTLVRGDGTTLPVELTSAQFTGGDGSSFTCSIFRDISARRQAAEAIRERDYLLSESQRIAHIGTWDFTLPDGPMEWSDETYRLFGVPPSFVLTHTSFLGLVTPEDRPAMEQWIRACAAGEPAGLLDFHTTLPDGRLRVLQGRGELRLPEGTRPLRMTGTVQDVTEQRQADEAQRREESKRDRLIRAIEQAAEMVVITDRDGTIEYVNPAFEKVTRYTKAEAIGQNPRFLQSGQHDAAFYQTLWETLREGRTWHGRFMNRRKTGEVFTEEATISPVRDQAGQLTGYVAVKRDITRELETEARLAQADRLESIGRLAGGVAHDFNNLLTVILGYTSALLDAGPSEDTRTQLEEIERAGERAAALTRQLLAFGRRQVLARVPTDINSVCVGLQGMLRRLIGEHVQLVVDLAPHPVVVDIDPTQLDQVVINLVLNARDAMPSGGRVAVATAVAFMDPASAAAHADLEPGPHAIVTVSDTGTGMDEATAARVFEPFFTTKETGRGTGLGLATVYGIVKQSGGTIVVYTAPELGSTFKVYLPLSATPHSLPGGHAMADAAVEGGSEAVLVVEDDDPVRHLAAAILSSAGYRVFTAASARDALELLQEAASKVSLVVTDMVMPGLGGLALADVLRQCHPGIQVLLMSGYAHDTTRPHWLADVGARFVAKPLTRASLLRSVRLALDSPPPR